jgi:hypothetical protein
MGILPPEPQGYWKFKVMALGAFWLAVAGGGFALDADLATGEGLAQAAAGAAIVALSGGLPLLLAPDMSAGPSRPGRIPFASQGAIGSVNGCAPTGR